MRGNVLNRKGMYNRCKLTRLVVYLDWEKKVWEEAWQTRTEAEGEEGGDEQEERTKPKRGRGEEGSRKRAKLDTPDGQIWGEAVSQPENPIQAFLFGGTASTRRATTQQEIRVISGMESVCRELLKEVANTAAEVATSTEAAADLEEWNESRPMRTRSAKELRFLYRMKDEFKVKDDISEYGGCKMFGDNPECESEETTV